MPKRKRRDKRAAAAQAAADTPVVDPQVALFAKRHQDEIETHKQAQRDRAEARKRADEHARLSAAKQAAADRLKAVRRKERIAPGEVEAAEAAYKAALADLLTFETGDRPTWAPSDPEPETQATTEVEEVEEEADAGDEAADPPDETPAAD